jgi:hypothetical protein
MSAETLSDEQIANMVEAHEREHARDPEGWVVSGMIAAALRELQQRRAQDAQSASQQKCSTCGVVVTGDDPEHAGQLLYRHIAAHHPAQPASARPDVAAELQRRLDDLEARRRINGLAFYDEGRAAELKDAIALLARVPAPAVSVDLEQIAREAAVALVCDAYTLADSERIILAALQRARV